MIWVGRLQAFSGRDGGLLWDEQNWGWTTPFGYAGDSIDLGAVSAVIGTIGTNPYPVVMFYDRPVQFFGGFGYVADRLRAVRVGYAGTVLLGAGCASNGPIPKIAVRRDAIAGCRVTLAGADPGVPAWLLIGATGQASWQGSALPMPLDSYGLPGCELRVPPTILWGSVTGTVGHDRGYTFVSAPHTLALTGLPVATQWLTLTPQTLGYAMSARHEFHLQ